MKRKIAAVAAAFALVAGGIMWASPATADDAPPPGEAVVQTEEGVVDEAVADPPAVAPVAEEPVAEPPAEPVAEEPAPVVEEPAAPVEEPTAPAAEDTDTVTTQGGYEHPKKVWVCKYVGIPGIDEVLKDGKNPIDVSVDSLKDFPGTFPWSFADAQGRSIAVGWSDKWGDAPDCPPGDSTEEVTPTLTWTPPTCDAPGVLSLFDGVGVVWGAVLNDDGSTRYTASPAEGFRFPEGITIEWTVPDLKQLAEDSDECYQPPVCDEVVAKGGYHEKCEVVPEPPVWVDECGPDNGHWTFPEYPEGYSYKTFTVHGYAVLVIVPDEGFKFPHGTKFFYKEKDSDEPCVTAIPTQFSAEPTPPTCDTDGALPNLEGDVAEIVIGHVDLYFDRPYDGPGTYTLNADALDGYTFPDGTTHKEREITVEGAIGFQSEDPEAPCFLAEPLTTTLATPTIDDRCGTANDFAFLPESTSTVFYNWADLDDPDNFDVLATIAEGYTVAGDTTGWADNENGTWTYAWDPVFTNVPCADNPDEPPAPPVKVTPPPPALASTGGGDVSLFVPLAGGIASALGAVLVLMGWLRRRSA